VSAHRLIRIQELLREVISEILRELKDPRLGFWSLTEVKVTPDLRHARVFVSIYGDENTRRETMAGLESAAGFVRGKLGREVRLRHVPELTFIQDNSLEHGQHMAELLARIGTNHPGPEPPD